MVASNNPNTSDLSVSTYESKIAAIQHDIAKWCEDHQEDTLKLASLTAELQEHRERMDLKQEQLDLLNKLLEHTQDNLRLAMVLEKLQRT